MAGIRLSLTKNTTARGAASTARASEPSGGRLPPPNTEQWDWQLHAACRGMASTLFFPEDGERVRARTARIARAKLVCARCPALIQCRDFALATAEPHGVWGGLSEDERLLLLLESAPDAGEVRGPDGAPVQLRMLAGYSPRPGTGAPVWAPAI